MIADPLLLSALLIGVMFLFLLSSIWIGASLFLTGIVGMLMYDHLPLALSTKLATSLRVLFMIRLILGHWRHCRCLF